jgi:hypothetical protein
VKTYTVFAKLTRTSWVVADAARFTESGNTDTEIGTKVMIAVGPTSGAGTSLLFQFVDETQMINVQDCHSSPCSALRRLRGRR